MYMATLFMCIGRDHDAFPIGDDRVDGHRYQLNGGEEKDGGGNTPNSPSIGRGNGGVPR